jgi:diadenosine tetraphosphate (Ap4A) HIT family hydrolase
MKISPEYQKYVAGEYPHWVVLVAQRQYCPGKVILWSREDVSELYQLSEPAWLELREVLHKVHEVLDTIFQPNLFNECKLGNSTPHLHLHVIPRYDSRRTAFWRDRNYKDEFWGKNFFEDGGYSDEARVPEEDVVALADMMRAHLVLREMDTPEDREAAARFGF